VDDDGVLYIKDTDFSTKGEIADEQAAEQQPKAPGATPDPGWISRSGDP
jgi:hypothetical protein